MESYRLVKTRNVNCMFCGIDDTTSIHNKRHLHVFKCKECHRVWHNMRTKYQQYGKGMTAIKLTEWFLSQPQSCKECSSTKNLTIDRIISASKGGKYEFGNIQILCYTCNCCKKTTFNSVAESLKRVEQKTCNMCFKTKPLNSKYWHKHPSKRLLKYRKNGLAVFHPACKVCRCKKEARAAMKKRKPTRLRAIKYMDVYEELYGTPKNT